MGPMLFMNEQSVQERRGSVENHDVLRIFKPLLVCLLLHFSAETLSTVITKIMQIHLYALREFLTRSKRYGYLKQIKKRGGVNSLYM